MGLEYFNYFQLISLTSASYADSSRKLCLGKASNRQSDFAGFLVIGSRREFRESRIAPDVREAVVTLPGGVQGPESLPDTARAVSEPTEMRQFHRR